MLALVNIFFVSNYGSSNIFFRFALCMFFNCIVEATDQDCGPKVVCAWVVVATAWPSGMQYSIGGQ